MPILSKAIYRFSAILTKILMAFLTKRTILKCVWKRKRIWIVNEILRKNKPGGITFPDFKPHHKTIVIKTVWSWHKNQHTYQWKRAQNKPMHILLIYDKTIQWEKREFPQKMVLGKLDSHMQKSKNWTTI